MHLPGPRSNTAVVLGRADAGLLRASSCALSSAAESVLHVPQSPPGGARALSLAEVSAATRAVHSAGDSLPTIWSDGAPQDGQRRTATARAGRSEDAASGACRGASKSWSRRSRSRCAA